MSEASGLGLGDLETLMRPALHRSTAEHADRLRLTRYRKQRPEIAIGAGDGYAGAGYWQAVVQVPGGSDTITRFTLGELLDELEKRYGTKEAT
ncbi:MAG TPA: hypothetical protein VKU39_18895 [Streptosporangiaceae bacterium]|nr:hypothetical protein [Streptosporangiaceae bacterium]